MRVNKFLLFLFIFPSFFLCSVFSQDQAFARQNPQTAYAKAQARYRQLLKNKKKRRLRTQWDQCIARFDKVASSPGASFARPASYYRAEAREGLYKVSRIQADLDGAAKAYSECIRDYPGSQEAAKATRRLKELGIAPTLASARSGAETTAPARGPSQASEGREKAIALSPGPSPTGGEGNNADAASSASTAPAVEGNKEETTTSRIPPLPSMGEGRGEGEKGLVRINEIRHWSNTGYTRVVIDMEGAVQYTSTKLKDPDRLFFDLKNAELPKDCKGSFTDVNDGILRKIRASQFNADTVRVVLDLASIASSRTLMLEHPTRLIIDVTGRDTRAVRASRHRRGRGGRVITLRPVNDLGTAPPLTGEAGLAVPESLPEAPPSTAANPAPADGQAAPGDGAAQPSAASASTPPLPSMGEGRGEGVPHTPAETGSAAPVDEEKVLEAAPYPGAPPRRAEGVAPYTAPRLGSATTIVPVTRERARASSPPLPSMGEGRGEGEQARAPRACGIGTIVIDPGHGGKDTGAIGCNGLYEKDVVLDIGLRLRAIIKKNFACKVVMTRDKDVFIDLDARPGIAVQNDADLFISIHANASKNPSAHGIETYLLNLTRDRNIMEVADRENFTAAKNMGSLDVILKDLILDSKRDESLKLAHDVQTSLVTGLRKDRVLNKGVKQGPFLVLYGASMPSILTEVGFITNPEEESHLADPQYREEVAQAIFDGIKEYIGSSRMASYQTPE